MDLFELDPLVGEKNGLFGSEEVGPGVCFAADLVTRAMRDEVSVAFAPPSVDLPLPEASGSSHVSAPVLSDVGVKAGSLTVGTFPEVLKGLWVIFSSSLMKEGQTKGLGVTNMIGSGVEPVGDMDNSLIRSAAGSSYPVCIVSVLRRCFHLVHLALLSLQLLYHLFYNGIDRYFLVCCRWLCYLSPRWRGVF